MGRAKSSVFPVAPREVVESKTSWAGMKARIDVLAGVGIEIPSDLGVASTVPPDDILDAAASAVAAERIARGAGCAVPDVPTQRDVTSGRAIQIWY